MQLVPVSFVYGVIRLPWWGYVALTFAMVLRHLFRFWLWFCSGTVTREWVAVHR